MAQNGNFNERILDGNIKWNIRLIATQLRHAEKAKVRARSGYYKIAVILTLSIVEALVHALLVKKLGIVGSFSTGKIETYECSSLPKKFYPEDIELAICKQREEIIKISKNPNFSVLNNTCLKLSLFSNNLFQKVEWARKIRNKIHLQGLDRIDRSYNKRDLEKISGIMNDLLSLLKQ